MIGHNWMDSIKLNLQNTSLGETVHMLQGILLLIGFQFRINYIQLFKASLLRDAPAGLTFNNCTLCPHGICVLCIYLRTNSDLCHLQHKLIGFYNRDEKCLQRGTDWVFK